MFLQMLPKITDREILCRYHLLNECFFAGKKIRQQISPVKNTFLLYFWRRNVSFIEQMTKLLIYVKYPISVWKRLQLHVFLPMPLAQSIFYLIAKKITCWWKVEVASKNAFFVCKFVYFCGQTIFLPAIFFTEHVAWANVKFFNPSRVFERSS